MKKIVDLQFKSLIFRILLTDFSWNFPTQKERLKKNFVCGISKDPVFNFTIILPSVLRVESTECVINSAFYSCTENCYCLRQKILLNDLSSKFRLQLLPPHLFFKMELFSRQALKRTDRSNACIPAAQCRDAGMWALLHQGRAGKNVFNSKQ